MEKIRIADIKIPEWYNKKWPSSQLVESLQKLGQIIPITIDINNYLADGFGRIEALKQLGIKYVYCVRCDKACDLQPILTKIEKHPKRWKRKNGKNKNR